MSRTEWRYRADQIAADNPAGPPPTIPMSKRALPFTPLIPAASGKNDAFL
jgi:hypothetical protein